MIMYIYPSLQFGGDPNILGKHEQSQRVPRFRGVLEYGPQGLGSHGSSTTTGSIAETCRNSIELWNSIL